MRPMQRCMFDGKTVTLDELDRALGALAQKHGVVLYSREAPQENEPHPVFQKRSRYRYQKQTSRQALRKQ